MAIRIVGRDEIVDSNRTDGQGVMIRYQADYVTDINKLPRPNGENEGSSVIVLENSSVHLLGTDASVGINGWVEL